MNIAKSNHYQSVQPLIHKHHKSNLSKRTILWLILAFSAISILIFAQLLLPRGKELPSVILANMEAGQKVYLPFLVRSGYVPNTEGEWTQHAHDAQHTSFSTGVVSVPWKWKWVWNGSNSSGGIVSGKFGLPRNSQPVTGGGRVYIAAGGRGVYALNESKGNVEWNRSPGGNINSTPAFDGGAGAVFVVSSNGVLYKLNAANGETLDQFATGSSSNLPLPPAIHDDRVFFSMGNRVYALNKFTLDVIWSYDTGSVVHTPPAYSQDKNLVIVVGSDLYVHAISNSDGKRLWRVKPTVRTGGNPGDSNASLAEASYGWPVIAEGHGLVLVKYRLDWQALWVWSPWPSTNSAMRSNLIARPEYQALAVLRLDNGSIPFIANVGHGGYGDGGYLPMGPQPVIKRFDNGQEVAYVVMRGSPCIDDPCDGRYDSHLGELMLDSTTVSGYQAGFVRFIENTNFPTDEQANLSMAGDYLFAAHWEAGIAHQILDRSSARGAGSNPITTSNLPHLVTSQDSDVCRTGFISSHYCDQGLSNTRWWPGGFYNYWNQGAVYDRYWSGYASWVISNDSIYFVSTDGSVIALESGNSANSSDLNSFVIDAETYTDNVVFETDFTQLLYANNSTIIPYTEASQYSGQVVTVTGTIQFVFNNGKAVYLGFTNPHQGAFKVRILREDWESFSSAPETLFSVGQEVAVFGKITWYQGDPVIYVKSPAQIK